MGHQNATIGEGLEFFKLMRAALRQGPNGILTLVICSPMNLSCFMTSAKRSSLLGAFLVSDSSGGFGSLSTTCLTYVVFAMSICLIYAIQKVWLVKQNWIVAVTYEKRVHGSPEEAEDRAPNNDSVGDVRREECRRCCRLRSY